tara:strand:- start:21542 stop:22873 length:1332 start_codon:yes stop_codon:yes gene_type:complete
MVDLNINSLRDGAANRLNTSCFCTTLNRTQMHTVLQADELNQDVLSSHPQLFSNTSVFISPSHAEQMRRIISAVTRVVKLPGYLQRVLENAPNIATNDTGAEGVFMGYDFHMSEQGPQIIEINTNAGGAFLNAALVSAQTKCCREAGVILPTLKTHLEAEFMDMFFKEWALVRKDKPLKVIAIVDENVQQQFLYPEFKMAQRLFEQHGLSAVIAEPSELLFIDGELRYQDQVIDLVYNRLTDFALENHESSPLRQAFQANAVVVTPNPHHHAVYADKRNLIILSDANLLAQLGADPEDITILNNGIPATRSVTPENADLLWQDRKQLFFKPAAGFGSRAAYRGDKLTKRVWQEISQGDNLQDNNLQGKNLQGKNLQGQYVAQKIVAPSERGILVDGQEVSLKMDIRAYVYAGEIQLLAARLYQGQTTNFRTQGGGFAPVFITP